MLVVTADEPTLTSVWPSSVVPISRARLASSRLTRAARRSPFFSKACMRAREAAVSAVSEAEKNADSATHKRMVAIASQTSTGKTPAPAPFMTLLSCIQFILKKAADLRGFDRLGYEAIADCPRKDEGEAAMLDLFVLIHGFDDRVGAYVPARDAGNAYGQANLLQMRFDPRLVLQAAKSAARREAERASHANRDRLAMHKSCSIVGGEALERMAKGMAEIEQRPFALLVLVARDNRRLGLAARRNRMNARRSPREDRPPIGFQPGVENRVADEAIFNNFGIASATFERRQSFK